MAVSDVTSGKTPTHFAASLLDWGSRLLHAVLTQRVVTIAAGVIFVLFILALAAVPFLHPDYNWDLTAYLAIAMENTITDHDELHRTVWGIMQAGATEDQFRQLTTVNAYNMAQYANPEFFYSQLVFYRVKIAYTMLLREFGPIIGYVETTQWINTLSVLVIGAVLMLWMRRAQILQSALLIIPLMLLGGFLWMAQLAVPDMLGTAVMLVGVYLIRIGRDWWAVPLLFLGFLIRTDMIIFLFALILASALLGGRILPVLTAFVLATLAYAPISHIGAHPGWWTHFYFTNVEIQNDMRGFHPPFSLLAYIEGVLRGVSSSFRFQNWLTVFVMLVLAWLVLLRANRVPRQGITVILLTASILGIGGKFVVFPLPESRVYFPYLVVLGLSLLELWRPRFDLEGRAAA
ncbi:hypothetical protein JYU29_09035 [Tianweitania sp. BSSL-BM11]|uniref:DUF2029 domain-containing protein n=1 Tax=Tianweitania aestuarii TaxID=2814886 RepID=A0ABS5RVN4_9HYPH|nr:hypothetical protein [Tianweitania aestuarii]MBS9720830.1 hypothetical protein [Tianweitania aestuarii]